MLILMASKNKVIREFLEVCSSIFSSDPVGVSTGAGVGVVSA